MASWHNISIEDVLQAASNGLVLLVHPTAATTESQVEQLHTQHGWRVVAVGRYVAEAVVELTAHERPAKAEQAARSAIESAPPGPVLVVGICPLFEPSLQLDPLALFRQLGRARGLAIAWPGSYDGTTLSYATPDHSHYRLWRAPGLSVVALSAWLTGG